ncbi:hypothetical protein FOA52_014838 [Chlamydomonas sp. UWO 241]|nr:hypothetical protein FOA52_014838 [Chlamydomonas sp. UWO 241]
MRTSLALLAAGLGLRLALLVGGFGDYVASRIEVSTLGNGVLSIREGVALLATGTSPYTGSPCYAPPLVLAGAGALAGRGGHLAAAVPFVAADAAAALLLRTVARHAALEARRFAPPGGGRRADGNGGGAAASVGEDVLVALYLFNPLTLAACVGCTTTCLESAAVVGAVAGAATGSAWSAAACVAVGAYLGLHPLLLLVSLAVLMLNRRPSSLHAAPSLGAILAAWAGLAARTAACLLVLAAASDAVLAAAGHPGDACLPLTWRYVRAAGAATDAGGGAGRGGREDWGGWGGGGGGGGGCWAVHVYSLPLLFTDQTPNIGQWWYLFAQVFAAQRPFFCFTAHALCALFALPSAVRFPRQGTLLVVLQTGINTMLRPYPSVGDLGLYLTLLATIGARLAGSGLGLLLSNSLLLLGVLAPAMWAQWIGAESANSNFFYSITLLLGVWHTLVLVQLVLVSAQLGHECKEEAVGGGQGGNKDKRE